MKYEFEVGYDRITNFDAPGYTDKEISTFLTKAQEQLVLELYKNGNHYKEDFKKSLNMIKTYAEVTASVTGPYPNSVAFTVPADVLVVYNEAADISTTSSHELGVLTLTNLKVKPVDDDFYHANKDNPFKKPSLKEIWRIDFHATTNRQHIYVLEPYCTFTRAKVHYYKKPVPIIIASATYTGDTSTIDGLIWSSYTASSSDCALDALVHREIVDRAIKLAFAAIQDEKGLSIAMAQQQEKS